MAIVGGVGFHCVYCIIRGSRGVFGSRRRWEGVRKWAMSEARSGVCALW